MHIQDISSCDYATSSFPHRYKSDIAKTNKRNKNLMRAFAFKMTATIDILIPYRRPVALAVTLTSLVADVPGLRIVISDQTEDSDPMGTGEVQAAACPPCSRSYHRYPQTSAPPWYSGTAPVLLEKAQVSTHSWTTTNSGTRCS